jgi:hypothetical protein
MFFTYSEEEEELRSRRRRRRRKRRSESVSCEIRGSRLLLGTLATDLPTDN